MTRLKKIETKCTKCGICKRVCPTEVTEVYERRGNDVTASGCMLCLRCVEMCPEKEALAIKFLNKNIFESRNWLNQK
jgi:ferredoxin